MNISRETALAVAESLEAPPLRRLGLVPRLLGRWLFRHARIDAGAVEYLRELSPRSNFVYVMRSRSLVEFLLVAHVLLREGLPLPELVSGLPTLVLRPLGEIARILFRRLRAGQSLRRGFDPVEESARCRELVAEGKPGLIFMRTRAPGFGLYRGAPNALDRVRTGSEYLRELVIQQRTTLLERPVALVPLAVVRGRGYHRKAGRFATLLYTVREAPGELRRLISLIWNSREISVVVGKEISLPVFLDRYRGEGAERLARRLAAALRIFLQREERLISGPTLLAKRVVREHVLRGAEYEALVAELVRREGKPEAVIRKRAAAYFDEMAANYHGAFFSVLAFVFNRMWPRIFGGFEHIGLDRVVDCARHHPIVLVPCHRSHFDYLILSYLFHQEYLSPPHIAAGINLSFWPLGPLFRGAGAYFIRRTFGDNELYKLVFRNYLTFLIREGYTQEFFIEGGRSRTGKMLTPKLGMLSALVNSFLGGARRDLYFVPVSIHYGRVVEEHAYEQELRGGKKEKETLGGLLRARKLLRQFYGSVYVSFAEPISLRESLAKYSGSTEGSAGGLDEERRRDFIAGFGEQILREVNAVTVAGATSITSTVLLGASRGALRYSDFVSRSLALADYLTSRRILMTASLREAVAARDFRKSCEFLGAAGLVTRTDGEIVHAPPAKRLMLDFYKNNTLHFFLLPCLVIRALGSGAGRAEIASEVGFWLDLYRLEFPGLSLADPSHEIATALGYLEQRGALGIDGRPLPEDPFIAAASGVLDNFHEAYWLVARELIRLPQDGIADRRWRERLHQAHQASLLLGEVRKPESHSATTLENALRTFAARGMVELGEAPGRGKRSRDRWLRPGPAFHQLPALAERLAAEIGSA